jgi:hypothetical protein
MAEEEKGKTWSEKIDISSKEVVERVKELIEEGNVRRLIVRGKNDEFRFELPVSAGVAVGGVVTLMMPWLAALGAIAALVARVEIEIVRANDGDNPPQ